MILAGELKFYQLQEKLTVKNKLRLGRDSNPYHPDTNWAMLQTELQSHTLWLRKILEDSSFFLEKTYAFCNEINQIEPWQTQVS